MHNSELDHHHLSAFRVCVRQNESDTLASMGGNGLISLNGKTRLVKMRAAKVHAPKRPRFNLLELPMDIVFEVAYNNFSTV